MDEKAKILSDNGVGDAGDAGGVWRAITKPGDHERAGGYKCAGCYKRTGGYKCAGGYKRAGCYKQAGLAASVYRASGSAGPRRGRRQAGVH